MSCPLLLLVLCGHLAGASADDLFEAPEVAAHAAHSLRADDECAQGAAEESEGCGLSALQRHGGRLTDDTLGDGVAHAAQKAASSAARRARGRGPDGEANGKADVGVEDLTFGDLVGDEEEEEIVVEEEDLSEEVPKAEEPSAATPEAPAAAAAPASNASGVPAAAPAADASEANATSPSGSPGTADAAEPDRKEVPTTPPAPAPAPKVNPWQQCGGTGYQGPTECVKDYTCWPQSNYYSQCMPSVQCKKTWQTYKGTAILNQSSKAPLLTFYMYRAQGPNDYPVENVNTASLGGLMWYVHNEVVSCAYGDCRYVRRFGINRIVRYKVQTRAPQPLYDAGMNFGIRYAYDHGQCTGPWSCDTQFDKYGFFVGCNNVSSGFPFPDWPVYYSGAWYSLPGPCSSRKWEDQNILCKLDQPGGQCKKEPTGTGTCTYTIETAGEITIDELEGLDDYMAFKEDGGEEYNKTLDEGINMTFWDGINDTAKNAERVQKASDLFSKKYPNMPTNEEMAAPTCDFDKPKFFPDGLPTELNSNTRERVKEQAEEMDVEAETGVR
uniref:CBM1 domain-containing protein n=1 Tax=Alexandrium catenella TaxID=2925 RepID=A0A7S1SBB2_ALECA